MTVICGPWNNLRKFVETQVVGLTDIDEIIMFTFYLALFISVLKHLQGGGSQYKHRLSQAWDL